MTKKKKLTKTKRGKAKEKKKQSWFDVHSDTIKSLWGVVFFVFFILSILSLVGFAGSAGDMFRDISISIFGWGMYMIPLVMLVSAYILFNSWKRNAYIPILVGGILFFSGILGILNILSGAEVMRSGYWGYIVSLPFVNFFGDIASLVIFVGFIVASIIISFNIKIGKILESRKEQVKVKNEEIEDVISEVQERGKTEFSVKTWNEHAERDEPEKKSQKKDSSRRGPSADKNDDKNRSHESETSKNDFEPRLSASHSDFRLPLVELLEKDTGRPSSGDILANANIIKRTFQNFGIEVEMGEVNVGPTITQFTLKPAEGVKLSRILALNNDLSLALAVHPIRIEAPIPGRSLVGIEIPNKGFTLVRLKNLLDSKGFKERSTNLTLCLGRDVSGAGIYANLARMPHLMIAGSTGSGKTIALNVVILSLLYQNSPDMLKFILIDPKRVEFPVYADIPHLLAPIVVDTQKSVGALKWAVSEMERRFDVLSQAHVRDIQSFNSNKKAIEKNGGVLPYIIIIIDELADLMASRGKDIEALVVRLAQMSRAVGIHLILATQRPSVEVITGLIKANITSRIAFQVASQVDSRTVLDMGGAEKLLGNGDMLYLSGDASKPRRIQGAYVTEKEIRRVTDYLREEGEKLQQDNAEEESEASFGKDQEPDFSNNKQLNFDEMEGASDDELYQEAKKVVVQAQKASSSLLQRRLRVGYARAARLIDMLEEDGVVGPGEGAKPREVFISRDEL